MSGYLDIHCHILPGVDDGPTTVEEAVALVEALAGIGFGEIYPTPHRRPGLWEPTVEETDEARARLLEALGPGHGAEAAAGAGGPAVHPAIHPAAREHLLDETLLVPVGEGMVMYPGGRAFLVEFPGSGPPPNLEDRLFEIRLKGILPVIAHVERYPSVTDDAARLAALSKVSALLVNLSSLGGWWWGRTARRLVKERLVHAGTTDCHGASDVEACEKGIQWIRGTLGEEAVAHLLIDNPRQILAGELPER